MNDPMKGWKAPACQAAGGWPGFPSEEDKGGESKRGRKGYNLEPRSQWWQFGENIATAASIKKEGWNIWARG